MDEDEAAALASAPGAPSARRDARGQARFDPNVIPGETHRTQSAVDFSRPFIVAPAVAKDGEEKIERGTSSRGFVS